MSTVRSPFDRAAAIADDLLYHEGHRRRGNDQSIDPGPDGRVRITARDCRPGVLTPPAYAMVHPAERSHAHAECLLDVGLDAGLDATLHVRVRFLQMMARTVGHRGSDGRFPVVDRAFLDDVRQRPWDEVVPRQVDDEVALADLLAASPGSVSPETDEPRFSWTHLGVPPRDAPWAWSTLGRAGLVTRPGHGYAISLASPGGRRVEPVGRPGDPTTTRIVWDTWPVRGELRLSAGLQSGPHHLIRLRAELVNTSGWDLSSYEPGPPVPADVRRRIRRGQALRRSLIGAHLLLASSRGHFLSLAAPPRWADRYVQECVNDGLWPVLVGAAAGAGGGADTVLAAPADLPDFPDLPGTTTSPSPALRADPARTAQGEGV